MAEVRMNMREVPQVDKLLKIKGVKDASIISYTANTA
jgi:hypothetical protein